MDLVGGVEKRFSDSAKRRISHGPRKKSKVRRGGHESPMDSLLNRIANARKSVQDAKKRQEKPNA